MKIFILTLLLLTCTITPAKAGDIVVIVNQENNITTLSKRELIDLYMGKKPTFSNGGTILTLDQEKDSEIRERFYKSLVNKSVAQMNAYWARLLFTGRVSPPRAISEPEAVVELVKNNRDAIAYIDSEHLSSAVKEVFRVE